MVISRLWDNSIETIREEEDVINIGEWLNYLTVMAT